jgi:hypothetical protein
MRQPTRFWNFARTPFANYSITGRLSLRVVELADVGRHLCSQHGPFGARRGSIRPHYDPDQVAGVTSFRGSIEFRSRRAAHIAVGCAAAAGAISWPRVELLVDRSSCCCCYPASAFSAYQDLSPRCRYWKDQYVSPSMTSAVIAKADLTDGSGKGRRALFVGGGDQSRRREGACSATGGSTGASRHGRPDPAGKPGDPPAAICQAAIIRRGSFARGLATAVSNASASAHVKTGLLLPAPACWSLYRWQASFQGAGLGAQRARSSRQPKATAGGRHEETQKITGAVLGYVTKARGLIPPGGQAMSGNQGRSAGWQRKKPWRCFVTDPLPQAAEA